MDLGGSGWMIFREINDSRRINDSSTNLIKPDSRKINESSTNLNKSNKKRNKNNNQIPSLVTGLV